MRAYFTPGTRRGATVVGVIGFIATLLIVRDVRPALLAGALITLITSVVIPATAYVEARKYRRLRGKIEEKILYDGPAILIRVVNGKSVYLGGYLFLTATEIYMVSYETSPAYGSVITADDIGSASVADENGAVFHLYDLSVLGFQVFGTHGFLSAIRASRFSRYFR